MGRAGVDPPISKQGDTFYCVPDRKVCRFSTQKILVESFGKKSQNFYYANMATSNFS